MLSMLFVAAGDSVLSAADWPQFRGPGGQGHSTERGLPSKWSERENVVWKIRTPGTGWSSPVVSGDRIYLTTCVARDRSLRVLCYGRDRGKKLFDRAVFRSVALGRIHPTNSHATPTLFLKDKRLYAHFGAHGTACLSTDGKVLWKTGLSYYHHHGPAACPIVVEDLLLVSCDGFFRPFYDRRIRKDVAEHQFIAALDVQTGDLRWKKNRGGRHSYSTPLAIEVNGQTQVICAGGDQVTAYAPADGREIWRCAYGGYSVVPRPVFGQGMVFVCTGYDHPSLLAIRPDGRGDVTESHVAWKTTQGVPSMSSPLLVGDKLYLISEQGVASCLDCNTGRTLWKQRLRGRFSASPLYADGRIYVTNEAGLTDVISPGGQTIVQDGNALDGRICASMAVADGSLFIRTDRHLYRVQDMAATSEMR